MKNKMEGLLRFYTGLGCAKALFSGCLNVVLRSYMGKVDRNYVTTQMRNGAIKILQSIRANYKISYAENFKLNPTQPRIYMSNHLSLFDTPLFFATIDDCIRIVTKKELLKAPLLGSAIACSEHAIVDRAARDKQQDFYNDVKTKLADGIAIWFFPEGTRSRTGELLPFRMGGFRLAAESGAQIIPVGIMGTDTILPADKILPHRNKNLEIRIGNPIDAREFSDPNSYQALMLRVRESIKQLIDS